MEDQVKTEEEIKIIKKGAIWGIFSALLIFCILIVFIITHLEETNELLSIIRGTDPLWLVLAALTEIFTYILAGNIWQVVARSAQYHIPIKHLAELAVEELSINQLIPAGGIAGHLVIIKAMKRLGLPNALTMEVVFIDLLAYYVAFSSATFVSLLILFLHHHITPIVLSLVTIALGIQLTFTMVILAVVHHKKIPLPEWIKRMKIVSGFLGFIEHISPERVFSTKLLVKTSLLRIGIFIFDSATLFLVMKSLGIPATFLISFVVVTMASVSGAVILVPGIIGGFEAGCIATLILLGIPAGEAIVITLLFRGLSMWIPLIPGLILARKDFGFVNLKQASTN